MSSVRNKRPLLKWFPTIRAGAVVKSKSAMNRYMPNWYGGRTRVEPFLNVTFDGLWIVHNGPIFRWPDSTPLPSKINSELFLGIHAGNHLGIATQRFKDRGCKTSKWNLFKSWSSFWFLCIVLLELRIKRRSQQPRILRPHSKLFCVISVGLEFSPSFKEDVLIFNRIVWTKNLLFGFNISKRIKNQAKQAAKNSPAPQ